MMIPLPVFLHTKSKSRSEMIASGFYEKNLELEEKLSEANRTIEQLKKENALTPMSKERLFRYEVAGAFWAGFISIDWIQDIIAHHIVRKVNKKLNRLIWYEDTLNKISPVNK